VPFCPKCRFEYLPAVRRCPDCGSALVAELPPEQEVEERQLDDVVLCTTSGEVEATLLRARLTGEGIPTRAQIAGVLPLVGAPEIPPSAQPVKVFVLRKDLERARAVWREFGGRRG